MHDPKLAAQVQELFHQVAELAPTAQQRALRDSAAPAAVVAEVQELLGWSSSPTSDGLWDEERLGAVGEQVVDTNLERFEPEALLGQKVDRYTLLEVLGSGGMGVVYLAEQQEPVRRRVALKVIKLGMDSHAVIARFDRERRALALMNHDAIAKVYDAGATERGQPYFVMELVEGQRLTDHCDDNRLGLRQRIELFAQVCAGIQHAHQKGVLHRDLKPSNILVTERNGQPVVKIIDFGVARATDPGGLEGSLFTEAGLIIGTPEYMSPEQAVGDGEAIDTRSDVYSLGVVLYELLTGSLPFEADTLRRAGLVEIQRVLREVDPPRPSTRITGDAPTTSETAARRAASADRLRRDLRGDLDRVLLKALAKEPGRRYASAETFAADLQRHLDDEPVLASPPSASYRVRKFLRRNKAAASAAALIFLTAIVGAVVALQQADRALRNAQLAEQRRVVADDRARVASERATENRQLAEQLTAKIEEFDLVAAQVRAEQLLQEFDALGPGRPERIADLQSWLDQNQSLQDQRGQLEAAMLRLRAHAVEVDPDGRTARMVAKPEFARWKEARRGLSEWANLVDVHEGRREPTRVDLPARYDSVAPLQLAVEAYHRCTPTADQSPDRDIPLALALAETSIERAPDHPKRHLMLRTLALAQLMNGLVEEAIQTADRAVAAAPEAEQEKVWNALSILREIASAPRNYWLDSRGDELHLRIRSHESQRFRFPAGMEREAFLHGALVETLELLDRLEVHAAVRVNEWLRWAGAIEELTFRHPGAAMSWADVREQVGKDPRFVHSPPALEDADVLGLMPLGPDPKSGLQEFLWLRSMWDRNSDPMLLLDVVGRQEGSGRLAGQGAARGIVFVLLPGGLVEERFGTAGAPKVSEVSLAPFLLGKHEVTQQQWKLLWSGPRFEENPATFASGTKDPSGRVIGGSHPIESVSWDACHDLLQDYDLALPSTMQWRYACRAGGPHTPWHAPKKELMRYANVADQAHAARFPRAQCESWNDRFCVHAPVGSLRPNAFGLHDMHGNVSEWVGDDPNSTQIDRPEEDSRLFPVGSNQRYATGGHFHAPAKGGSLHVIGRLTREHAGSPVGVRAMRRLRRP